MPLIAHALLDPRPEAEAHGAPIADSVNIPFAELPHRTHELPGRSRIVEVAGPADLAERVVQWLHQAGRAARVQAGFRYATDADPSPRGRLWSPNPFLEDVVAQLRPGSALDLACGTGRDAVYLASRGWQVTAVDVLPDALARGRDLAARYAPDAPPIRWIAADLERESELVDGTYDLIACFRYLHRPLLALAPRWLKPGGSFVVEVFTTQHRAEHGKPRRAADVVAPGELPSLLPGLDLRQYSEACRDDAHTARLWGYSDKVQA